MGLHIMSLAIGAGLAASAILAVFVIMDSFDDTLNEVELDAKPTLATLLKNGSPRLGSEDAPVTIVEFGDYQCFFCGKFYKDTEKRIIDEFVDTGKVSLIFKDYIIIGPDSKDAAIGARCAADQGRFWEYHDILYDNWAGENNGWISEQSMRTFASDAGLNVASWTECTKSGKHDAALAASNADARTLGLTGTPAFFIIYDDESVVPVIGAQPYEVFEQLINRIN